MDLLSDRESNEAYLAAKPGEQFAVYFTNSDTVKIDLSHASGQFELTWISVSQGITTETAEGRGYRAMEKLIQGGDIISLTAPYKGGWVAALVKQ